MPFLNLDDLEAKKPLTGYRVKFIHSSNMTFAYLDIDAGAVLPEHNHPQEQVVTMLTGKFELTINEETEILEPGSVAIIPSNAVHSGRAITNCWMTESFYPHKKERL